MGRCNRLSHVSAPRKMRFETNTPIRETCAETACETSITKQLIDKVLSRSQMRQTARQPERIEPETVRQTPSIPSHVRDFLDISAYELSAWSPAACRGLLDRLEAEWEEEFKVHGWRGLTMPDSWPWETQSAVISIYVKSMQEVPHASA